MVSLPISIAKGFTTIIKADEQIFPGQIIARNTSREKDITINIPSALKISVSESKTALLKIPGSEVKIGAKIAVVRGFFGAEKKALRSKIDGFVTKYNRQTGDLIIRNFSYTKSPDEIRSPVAGMVTICNNEQVVIATSTHAITARNSRGNNATGELFVIDGEDILFLNKDIIGKIVAGRSFTREMISKAIGIGAAGLVGEVLEGMDEFSEKYPEMSLLELDAKNMDELISYRDKKVFIDGKTKAIIPLEI